MLDDGGPAGVVEGQVAWAAEQTPIPLAQHAPELPHAVLGRLVLGRVGGRSWACGLHGTGRGRRRTCSPPTWHPPPGYVRGRARHRGKIWLWILFYLFIFIIFFFLGSLLVFCLAFIYLLLFFFDQFRLLLVFCLAFILFYFISFYFQFYLGFCCFL